jgi:hypothetical protein
VYVNGIRFAYIHCQKGSQLKKIMIISIGLISALMAADARAMFALVGRGALRAPQRSRMFSQKDRLLQSHTKIDESSDSSNIYYRLQDIDREIKTHVESCVVCYVSLQSTTKRYENLKAPSILERLPVLG